MNIFQRTNVFRTSVFFVLLISGLFAPKVFGFAEQASADTRTVCDSGCDYTSISGAAMGFIGSNNTIQVNTPYTPDNGVDFINDGHEINLNVNLECNNNGAVIGYDYGSQLQLAVGTSGFVSGLSIQNCTFYNVKIRVLDDLAGDTQILNNIFQATSSIGFGDSISGPIISNNTGLMGVYFQNMASGTISNNTFNLAKATNGFNALYLASSTNIYFGYNTVNISTNTNAIDGNNGTGHNSNITITHNTFRYTTPVIKVPGTMFGIIYAADYSSSEISYNYFDTSLLVGVDPANGIAVAQWTDFPVDVNIHHNTFYGNFKGSQGSGGGLGGADGVNITNLNQNVSVTGSYNLFYSTFSGASENLGRAYSIRNYNFPDSTISVSSNYDGFWNFGGDASYGGNTCIYGVCYRSSTYSGTNSKNGLNPYLRINDGDQDNNLYPAPWSNYLDVNGGEDIGAFSAARNTTFNFSQNGVIDYSTIDATSTQVNQIIADNLRDGDTLNFSAGTFGQLIVSSTSLVSSSITINGAGDGTIFSPTSTTDSAILLNGVSNSTVQNLRAENASSTVTSYTITNAVYDRLGVTYGDSSMVGSPNTPDNRALILGNGCSDSFFSTSPSDADITSSVGPATSNWNLALIDFSTIKLTVFVKNSVAVDGAALASLSGCDGVVIDRFVNDIFTVSGGVYSYNAAALDGTGVTLTSPGITNPPRIDKNTTINVGGIKLLNSNSNIITNVTSTVNAYGAWFAGTSYGNNIVNSAFSNNIYDIFSDSNNDNVLTNNISNSSFDSASSSVTGTGDVNVYFNVQVHVTDGFATPLDGVIVGFTPNNGGASTTAVTGPPPPTIANGSAQFLSLPGWVMTSSTPNSTTSGNYNPYTITADAYSSYSQTSLSNQTVNQPNQVFTIVMSDGSGSGWNGNLPAVSSDAKTKLLLVDGVYYLGFSSSTGTGYRLFLTTSTNGNAGTWSQPVDVFGVDILKDSTMMATDRNGLFALDYNSVGGYFGAAIYYDTGAGNQIWFTTSTNGGSWSSHTVAVSNLDAGSFNRNLYLDFTESGNLGAIIYNHNQFTFTTIKAAYTTDDGVNWNISSSSYSIRSGVLIGGRVSGDSSSPVFHFGYANTFGGMPTDYSLQYVSSLNFGTDWVTSTVVDNINYNPGAPFSHDTNLSRLATFDLDSLDRPSFSYYVPTADVPGVMPGDIEYVTSSLMFSQPDGSGGWNTATSAADIAWQVTTNYQESDNFTFYGTTPIFTGVGPSYLPAVLVNTSSWSVFPLSETVTSSEFSRPSSVYNTSTQLVATVHILGDGSFNFSTTSMSLPAPDNAPSVTAISPVFSNSVSGLVTVTTTVSDVDNDPVNLKVQYSLNGGSTWVSSTVHVVSGDGGAATTSSGKIDNITGTSLGSNLVFTWDTKADGLSTNVNALLRITPNDGLVDGSIKTSASFAVNDWNGNLPIISTDGQTKLLLVNDVYYLGYSSAANDGTYHVYFTTSTNGSDGSWSQPVDVFNHGIRPDTFYSTTTPINGNFALNYNSLRGYFGAAIYATGSQQIWFASSTAGSSWSATTTVATISSMEQNPQVRRRLFLDFSKTSNLATIFYNDSPWMGKSTVNMAYSDNDGVGTFGSWSNSTANSIQGELIGGRVTGSAASHTFYVGYFMSEAGGMDQYSLVSASSTGMMWNTSKVASGLNFVDGSVNLNYSDLYGFDLDDNLNPAFTYYQTTALNTSTYETTSSLIYVSGNSSTTIASNIHWQLVDNSNQKLANLIFNSSTPIFVGAVSNFELYGAANTSTWNIFSINNSPLSQKSNVSAVYDTSTQYLASSYVLNNGALKFTTTSLDLTIIPPPPPVPVVPTGLNISPVSTTAATINWTSGNGDEDIFFLEFSVDGGETYPYSATTSVATTSYNLTNLSADTQYFVRLSSAVVGVSTSTVVTTSFYTSTYDPIMPLAGIPTTSSVVLSWQENGNPSTTVYRITGGDSVVEVASTSVELSATPNTTYDLFVASLNHDGSANNAVSFGFSIMTPATVPGKPTAVANGQTSMIVSWSANNNSTSTIYKLYNVTDSIIVTSTITSTSYTVTNLIANTPYQFNVSAYYGPANISETDTSENSDAASTASIANTVSISLPVGASSTFQFLVDGIVHTATLNSISDSRASITVESNPVTVTLGAGQSQNIDTDGNGVNDMTVTVSSVGSGSASFSLASYTPPVVSSGGGGGYSAPVVPVVADASTAVTVVGGTFTNSQTITLNFLATNAAQLAISEDPNFADASWQTYASSKSFVLSKGFGTKSIYVKFRSKDGGATQVYKVNVNYQDKGGNKTEVSNLTTEPIVFETTNPDSDITILPPKKLQYAPNSNVNYTYQFTNTTNKNLKTKIVRQVVDVKNKVVGSVSGTRVINSGKVFKFNAISVLSKSLKDGVYTIKVKVLDAKTGKVLDENGFNITVKKPVPVKVVKKAVVPAKKK